MSRTGAFILLVLVVIAIVSSWLKTSVPEPPAERPQELARADYFITDFHIRQFNQQGRLHYRMRGKRMEHYPADDSAVIEHPKLSVNAERPGEHWTVSARRASAPSRALDEIIFQGDVDMRRPASANRAQLALHAQRLIIRPDAETVTSDNTVVLSGPGARIEGEDLRADLKRGIVELQQVRARYAP